MEPWWASISDDADELDMEDWFELQLLERDLFGPPLSTTICEWSLGDCCCSLIRELLFSGESPRLVEAAESVPASASIVNGSGLEVPLPLEANFCLSLSCLIEEFEQ